MKDGRVSSGLYIRSANGLRTRDEKVRRLVRKMQTVMPWLTAAHEPACRGFAQLEVLSDVAFALLRKDGIIGVNGAPKRLLDSFRLLRLAQLAYARELGMTPLSMAQLKLSSTNAAFDLAALCARSGAEDVGEGADDTAALTGENGNG